MTLVKTTFGVASMIGAALVAGACSSDNAAFNPRTAKGPDANCVAGELTVGTTVNGDLSAATACSYPLFWDSSASTINESYNFGTQKGKGYVISLQANWDNHVELIGGPSTAEVTLAEADYEGARQSTLAFVATGNTGYSVRVGADDNNNNSADTGAFVLRAQTCKVPLGTITDSVTHADTLGMGGDCTLPEGDYVGSDSSFVHLYTIHFDSGASRNIYLTVPGAPLAFNLGGPGFDPYGYFETSTWLRAEDIDADGSGTFTAGDSGTYTMVIGTETYQASPQGYTLTVGTEMPAASHVTPPPTGSRNFGLGQVRMISPRKRGR
jgi:hypothetical protein